MIRLKRILKVKRKKGNEKENKMKGTKKEEFF